MEMVMVMAMAMAITTAPSVNIAFDLRKPSRSYTDFDKTSKLPSIRKIRYVNTHLRCVYSAPICCRTHLGTGNSSISNMEMEMGMVMGMAMMEMKEVQHPRTKTMYNQKEPGTLGMKDSLLYTCSEDYKGLFLRYV